MEFKKFFDYLLDNEPSFVSKMCSDANLDFERVLTSFKETVRIITNSGNITDITNHNDSIIVEESMLAGKHATSNNEDLRSTPRNDATDTTPKINIIKPKKQLSTSIDKDREITASSTIMDDKIMKISPKSASTNANSEAKANIRDLGAQPASIAKLKNIKTAAPRPESIQKPIIKKLVFSEEDFGNARFSSVLMKKTDLEKVLTSFVKNSCHLSILNLINDTKLNKLVSCLKLLGAHISSGKGYTRRENTEVKVPLNNRVAIASKGKQFYLEQLTVKDLSMSVVTGIYGLNKTRSPIYHSNCDNSAYLTAMDSIFKILLLNATINNDAFNNSGILFDDKSGCITIIKNNHVPLVFPTILLQGKHKTTCGNKHCVNQNHIDWNSETFTCENFDYFTELDETYENEAIHQCHPLYLQKFIKLWLSSINRDSFKKLCTDFNFDYSGAFCFEQTFLDTNYCSQLLQRSKTTLVNVNIDDDEHHSSDIMN